MGQGTGSTQNSHFQIVFLYTGCAYFARLIYTCCALLRFFNSSSQHSNQQTKKIPITIFKQQQSQPTICVAQSSSFPLLSRLLLHQYQYLKYGYILFLDDKINADNVARVKHLQLKSGSH